MQRVCFQLQVRENRLDEYVERHASVPPEMLREIEAAGRRNYSLFLRKDGLLVGYFEADDVEAGDANLAASPVAIASEREAAGYFEDLEGRPDQNIRTLTEVFNLEEQLARRRG